MELSPELHGVLLAVPHNQVQPAERGGRRIWLVNGRPNTPAVESLLDSGLIIEASTGWRAVVLTAKGRAALENGAS